MVHKMTQPLEAENRRGPADLHFLLVGFVLVSESSDLGWQEQGVWGHLLSYKVPENIF